MKKTAEELAKEQKEISISEFFEKNKHLLGFDNPSKALLMAVKEAVDNSLDACQEAEILPDIVVKVKQIKDDIFNVSVEDNGPGIIKEQIPKVFGKLLYGSKFHKLKQNRGQQGLGISTTVLYSQLTTGNPTKIWSRVESKNNTYYCELHIDTLKNEPEIVKEEMIKNGLKEHGVKVEFILSGRYRKQIEDYLKATSIANPFAKIIYYSPKGKITFPRSVNELPKPPKEMKPHPYGMEFGLLLRMLSNTKSKTLASFISNDFSSVGIHTAKEICKIAKLDKDLKPKSLTRDQIEKLLNAMQKVKIQRPPLDCLSPIGEEELKKSLRREYPEAEFIATLTRDTEVYRGFPFIIECGIVYGLKDGQGFELIRFANRVPLMYQAGACAITEAMKDIDWKRYGLQQTQGIPDTPMKIIVHMCSAWVPFISESKNAIASYPEIVKEIKLTLQQTARKLSHYLSGKRREYQQQRRIEMFQRYASEIEEALSKLTNKPISEIKIKIDELIRFRIKSKKKEKE